MFTALIKWALSATHETHTASVLYMHYTCLSIDTMSLHYFMLSLHTHRVTRLTHYKFAIMRVFKYYNAVDYVHV